MTVKLSVLGTCASDEWFIRQNVRRRLDIDRSPHSQHSALVSITSAPATIQLDGELPLPEMECLALRCDFDKSFLGRLTEVQPDFLLIDLLLDSRRGVVSVGDTWVTNSYMLERSGLDDILASGTQFSPVLKPVEYCEAFREAARKLKAFLGNNVPGCKIILHQPRWAEFFLDESDVLRSEDPWTQNHYFVANLRLQKLEEIFRQEISCQTLRVDDIPVFADSRHMYGLSAVHYQKSYYAAFTEKLKALTGADIL